jgi:hypothetical protein
VRFTPRLGRKQEWISLAAAPICCSRRLTLGNVPGVDGDNAYAAPVRRHHHAAGLILTHAEFRLQDGDDELPRRKVVIDENDLVQARSFRLKPNLDAWPDGDVAHPATPVDGATADARCHQFHPTSTVAIADTPEAAELLLPEERRVG